jgi:ferredoxin
MVNGQYPCVTGCHRGGYPKIGQGRTVGAQLTGPKANKCTLCYGRAGSDAQVGTDALPTRAKDNISRLSGLAVPELAHEPACVSSCPAKAMVWDTRANIVSYLANPANGFVVNGTVNVIGNGSMYWASKKTLLAPPKADPLVEDHLTPLASDLTSTTLKVALPTLVIGGLAALSARRARVEEEASLTKGGVA